MIIGMKKRNNTCTLLLITLFMCFSAAIISGCDEHASSLYDPNEEPDGVDPVINSISPEGGWIAGVEGVTITGENFSDQPDENRVYFGDEPGEVMESTSTELTVVPSRVIGENLPVKVSVIEAMNFSNSVEYTLDQAVFPAPGSLSIDNALGITSDSDGNIIFAYEADGVPRGIRKWDTTEDNVERIIPSQFVWSSLKVGPDGLIYGARNIFGIYRETASGTIDNNPFAVGVSGEAYRDMDFDPDHNLWAVGDNENIFRIDIESGSVDRFPFDANLRAVRYYEGNLYMGGRFDDGSEDGSLEIWTMDINDGEASNPQQYLNISDTTEQDFNLFSITFDVDGTIYLGTDTGTGIFTWNEQDGLKEFYPDLVLPTGYSLSWTGEHLVASATNRGEETRHALKIDVRKEGAPYFGIK